MTLDRLIADHIAQTLQTLSDQAKNERPLALKKTDIAKHFSCSLATAEKMMTDGTFRTVRHGRRSYVPRSELARFLRDGTRHADLPADTTDELIGVEEIRAVIREELTALLAKQATAAAVATGQKTVLNTAPDLRRII